MRPVTTKHDFVIRYQSGEFGNHSHTWDSLDEFLADCYHLSHSDQLYHVRNRIPGGRTLYNKTYSEIGRTTFLGIENLYVSAMAPTEKTLIQGECCRVPGGLYLRYSRIKRPMRDALAYITQESLGLKTNMILQKTMDPPSWEWLNYLLDEYDDHIVEFSTYSVEWGAIPGYNTVFWEVRPNRQFSSNRSSFTEIY